MPSPPKKNETQKQFISRCISYMTENNEGKNPAQRAAICYSMWRDKDKKSSKGDASMNEEQMKFIKEGKKTTINTHAYPEIPPLPDGYTKPKGYLETLEDEIRNPVAEKN